MNDEASWTQELFDSLLSWLDHDRQKAGDKYLSIRRGLVKIFTCRGCSDADGLADKAIGRVMSKVKVISPTYLGDPALYFYGVAQNVYLEERRKPPVDDSIRLEILPSYVPPLDEDLEQQYYCLERCMEQLPEENRRLVLEYYENEKGAKISNRKRLASDLGIALNALRIRAHRIRASLQRCMDACVEKAHVN
jgi:DNA-directed RNA polymerase specialized sigma24 family protein